MSPARHIGVRGLAAMMPKIVQCICGKRVKTMNNLDLCAACYRARQAQMLGLRSPYDRESIILLAKIISVWFAMVVLFALVAKLVGVIT